MTALLEALGVDAGYGRIPILNQITLTVATGEFVGILGHNGMGKTTLLKALMGLLPVQAGRIRFAGADITRAAPERRAGAGLGYVPQGRRIFPGLSVRDNLRMGAVRQRRPDDTVALALEDFPRLKPLLDRPGGALSGGEQQLLAMARCLCGDPRLILLDEPTEGIQPSIIDEIIETLARIRTARGLAMVLVEQNLDFIAALSDRVLVIQKGTIIREGSVDSLAAPEMVGEFVGMPQ